jgi:hypothetical protein
MLSLTSLTIWPRWEQGGSGVSGCTGSKLVAVDPVSQVGVKLASLVGVNLVSLVAVDLASLGGSWYGLANTMLFCTGWNPATAPTRADSLYQTS